MLTATRVQAPEPLIVYVRQPSELGALGADLPGLDTMATVGKTIYYVGVGTALIAAGLFVWKAADALFGP